MSKASVIHSVRLKKKNHINISTNAEKAFEMIQHLSTIKVLSKQEIEGVFVNMILKHYQKPLKWALYLQVKIWVPFSWDEKQGRYTLLRLLNVVTEVLAEALRQENQQKDIQMCHPTGLEMYRSWGTRKSGSSVPKLNLLVKLDLFGEEMFWKINDQKEWKHGN